MTTRWRITSLSTRDTRGRYLDEIAGGEDDYETVFDAKEPITGAAVELWRITREDERTTASSPLEVPVPGGASCVAFSPYLYVTATGMARHEIYRLVIVLDGVQNGDWARTRMIEAVA